MHKEILTQEQIALLPLVKEFSRNFYLVGGTAIALYIGHRQSIDFDLFTQNKINNKSIKNKIFAKRLKVVNVSRIFEDTEQMHYLLNGVKFTFFNFNFKIPKDNKFENIIRIPSLLELAAMKAFALGGRGKWKDYIDLYFILKNFHSLNEISDKACELFEGHFNRKLFLQQLSFFKDVDYSEEVSFMSGFEINNSTIKKYLVKVATEPF